MVRQVGVVVAPVVRTRVDVELESQNREGRHKAEQIVQTVLFSALHKTKKDYGEKGDWSHNPEDWERARLALAEELERK